MKREDLPVWSGRDLMGRRRRRPSWHGRRTAPDPAGVRGVWWGWRGMVRLRTPRSWRHDEWLSQAGSETTVPVLCWVGSRSEGTGDAGWDAARRG